jgi:hypothetical protein
MLEASERCAPEQTLRHIFADTKHKLPARRQGRFLNGFTAPRKGVVYIGIVRWRQLVQIGAIRRASRLFLRPRSILLFECASGRMNVVEVRELLPSGRTRGQERFEELLDQSAAF